MRVLLVHNFYQQAGGEDQVFLAETDLLRAAGHDVQTLTVHNDDLDGAGRLQLVSETLWNRSMAVRLAEEVRSRGSEVVHFHNTFPRVSPAAYSAVQIAGAATVQTLHNYRLTCANALLFRDGHVCEDCLGHLPLPALRHRCYRNSLSATGVVVALQVVHRALGTYQRGVDAFIALTDFARDTLVRSGLPADRMHVKPNFLAQDPGPGPGGGGYALFVGRLTPEKGVRTLLQAWKQLGGLLPLKVVGDGPLRAEIEAISHDLPGVEVLGPRSHDEVLALAAEAECLMFPSEWYEGFPMTIVEAYAVGLPVLASRIGSLSSLIDHGITGFSMRPGDPDDIARQVRAFLHSDRAPLRQGARARFVERYSAPQNLERLEGIYRTALEVAAGRRSNY